MKKLVLAIVLHLLGMAALHAQITCSVKDEQGHPVNHATVSLLKATDSSVVKLELSKEVNFAFGLLRPDTFLLSISYVGYQTYYSQPFSFSGSPLSLPVITLPAPKANLAGVTVVARKKVL